MRDDLPFDDFVKAQFSDYSPNVPEHIWENIVAKRKTKPKGFWINFLTSQNVLILTCILLVAGGTSYLLFSPEKNNPFIKNIVAERGAPSQQKTETVFEKKTEDNRAISPKDQSSVLSDKSVRKENTIADDLSENSINPYKTSTQNNLFTIASRKKGSGNTNVNPENTDEINFESSAAINSKESNRETLHRRLFSPFIFNNARELTNPKTLTANNIKLPECPAIEKNAAGNKMYWELYAGPDRAFDNYKSYGDTASNNYLLKRKASTKFASAFSAGVRYTKVFNNGTSIRAGVNYTQVNEKFLYFNPNEIKNVTVITTRVIIRAPGDTIYINDTLQYQQTGTRIKTTYNRYHNIDVPLLIGYEFGNGKIHANINAGVIINIYSWYKGDVLDTLYQPVSITTGKNTNGYQFKNNIGVGFMGSISVYYKITDKLHLVLEPYFRYNLSPMSKENLNLQQKYHIAGVHAGVRFDLK